MTVADESRLAEIESLAVAVASTTGNGDALGPRFRKRAFELAEEGVPYLLARLRAQDEALARVAAIMEGPEHHDPQGPSNGYVRVDDLKTALLSNASPGPLAEGPITTRQQLKTQ